MTAECLAKFRKGSKEMNESKKNYAKKCKSKIITFYGKDADLLEFANTINFQAFVKQCLKIALLKKGLYK